MATATDEQQRALQGSLMLAWRACVPHFEEISVLRRKVVMWEEKVYKLNTAYLKEVSGLRDKLRDPEGSRQSKTEVTMYDPLVHCEEHVRELVGLCVKEEINRQ